MDIIPVMETHMETKVEDGMESVFIWVSGSCGLGFGACTIVRYTIIYHNIT